MLLSIHYLEIVVFSRIFNFGSTTYGPCWIKTSISSFGDLPKLESFDSDLKAKTLMIFGEFFDSSKIALKLTMLRVHFHFLFYGSSVLNGHHPARFNVTWFHPRNFEFLLNIICFLKVKDFNSGTKTEK